MSGNHGIRGYLVQTIISVLDALTHDNEWTKITLEPLDESEKVDIRWTYSDGSKKVTQVKSSINIIKHSQAKKWSEELEKSSTEAESFELILVGFPDEKLSTIERIGKVDIPRPKGMDIDGLLAEASTKIDSYYEQRGKSKISSKVRELLVKVLTLEFGTNSIIGKELTRAEFDHLLINWISSIENQIDINPYTSLAPPEPDKKEEIGHRLTRKILELIGWKQFSENVVVESYNEHENKDLQHEVNFCGHIESRLKDNIDDYILVNSIHEVSYPSSSKQQIKSYVFDVNEFIQKLAEASTFPIKSGNETDIYSLLFWYSTNNDEVNDNFIHYAKENYKNDILNDRLTYFLIDNLKVNFLISSIITAKGYRPDRPVKFLYPITELNSSPELIGKRGLQLPPQYINSSLLPIIKEDNSKISILLFCADPYDTEALRKLIWFIIKLTSGLGNEYVIYFPDFTERDQNEAKDVIRSFDEEDFRDKITVKSYSRIDAQILDSHPHQVKPVQLKDEIFDESKARDEIKQMNSAFINSLPYGDILKPFLKTDAISAQDLKIFLAQKGIYLKYADKNKIIKLMSTLLFSPQELESFKAMIEVKQRPINSVPTVLKIKVDQNIDEVFKRIKPNFDNITEGLQSKLLKPVSFKKNPDNNNEFIFDTYIEKKDPTAQLSVNTTWDKVIITYKKEGKALVLNTVKTSSKDGKIVANRITKKVEEEMKRIDFVEEEKIELMFRKFADNAQRVNFLLSFTNIQSSHLFKDQDIKSVKFLFDESQNVPESLKDKIGKDIVMYLRGKNLSGINEITDETVKKITLLEEVEVGYRFEWLNVRGSYYVKYNFSDAFKNKHTRDGVFRSQPNLFLSPEIKKLSNIERLKRELSNEVERLKLEKLRQFNFI